MNLKNIFPKLKLKSFDLAFLIILFFPFYFTYDLYTGAKYFSHNDFPGMYYPFRHWFLERLLNFEFPLWNPYWGAGHEALIWATLPVDPYTILEIFMGPRYEWFHLIQCGAMVILGFYVFKKLKLSSWAAAASSLLFFMSPLVTYWYFHFIKTNLIIGHIFAFLFMIKWFETGRLRYPVLMGWSIFLGMFGTKLEYWFYEAVFFALFPVMVYFIMGNRRPILIIGAWLSIGIAILAHAWQINLLLNSLNYSGRMAIPHSLSNIFSQEMYKNLFLSLRDTDFIPLFLICGLFYLAYKNSRHQEKFIIAGILFIVIFKAWEFSFIMPFLKSPVIIGAIFAALITIFSPSRRLVLPASILFMLPAYYWFKPLINNDELYLLGVAPVIFKGIWGFLIWMGCLQVNRIKAARIAYFSIMFLFLLQNQGQIILSYLFGYLWLPARDNYIIDFSFAILAGFGMMTQVRYKPFLILLIPLLIAFSSFKNLYYTAPYDPVPGYANPLLNSRLPYSPYEGIPALRNILKNLKNVPYRRILDPDIEFKVPQNQGAFLTEGVGNATFYGSMTPARYRELINYYRYGFKPENKIGGYPSTYSPLMRSRLPRVNTNGLDNGLIYASTVWITPPFDNELLRLLGVEYIISRNPVPEIYPNVKKEDEFNIARIPNTLPRAFIVKKLDDAKNIDNSMKPKIELDEARCQVLPSDSGGAQLGASNKAIPAEIIKYKPEYVEIRSNSKSGGYLILSDIFHPYWSARVDGIRADIIPAFYAFRGVKIPSGRHKIEFICKVPYFREAFFLSLSLIFISLIITFLLRKRELKGFINE